MYTVYTNVSEIMNQIYICTYSFDESNVKGSSALSRDSTHFGFLFCACYNILQKNYIIFFYISFSYSVCVSVFVYMHVVGVQAVAMRYSYIILVILDSIRADRRALYIVVVTMKLATAEKTSTQVTQIVYRLLVIDNGQ